MSVQLEEIKKERERFVAFAFAAAEIFFEIDDQGKILFEGGASERLTADKKSLVGASFFDQLHLDDRDIMMAMMDHLDHKGRIGPMPLRFTPGENQEIALRLFALRMPDTDKRTFLALRSAPMTNLADDGLVDPATGLLSKDTFLALTEKTMKEDGSQLYVTAVKVDGIEEARNRFGQRHGERLLKRIAAHLKAVSVDGSAASQIGDGEFAFLHRSKTDCAVVEKTIPNADSTVSLATKSTTIAGDNSMAEGEVLRTLNYILTKFCENPESCDFANLANAYHTMAKETQGRLDQMRATIQTGSFKMAFQPIVSLVDNTVHHHEVLSRFSGDDNSDEKSARDIIGFAEDVGIIEEFDLSLCKKTIDYVRKMRRLGSHVSLSINISGRTLDSGRMVETLVSTLLDAKDVARSIMLELTETKAIHNLERVEKILNDLKVAGYRICLDDFGSGAAGYQYLRALNVDFVKIDGIYVREMSKADYRPTFLLSMVRLCGDLGIKTIGEHVETRFQAEFLRSLGVKFGQGYHFGRPTFSPKLDG